MQNGIRRCVEVTKGILRNQDTLMRLGGEEFAILLPATDSDEAIQVAQRIRTAIEAERFSASGQDFAITSSFGVSHTSRPTGNDLLERLIHEADTALYEAKEGGRNQVRAYEGSPGTKRKSGGTATESTGSV